MSRWKKPVWLNAWKAHTRQMNRISLLNINTSTVTQISIYSETPQPGPCFGNEKGKYVYFNQTFFGLRFQEILRPDFILFSFFIPPGKLRSASTRRPNPKDFHRDTNHGEMPASCLIRLKHLGWDKLCYLPPGHGLSLRDVDGQVLEVPYTRCCEDNPTVPFGGK